MQTVTRYAIALGALATVAPCTSELTAQALWVDRQLERTIDVSFARPGIEGSDQALLSGAGRIAGTFPIKGTAFLRLELPGARANFEGVSETMIGAPYIGVVGGAPESDVRYQIGIRLAPGASTDGPAADVGVRAEYEQFEAYLSEFVGLRTSVQFGRVSKNGLTAQVRLGGTLLVSTGEGESDPEGFADYGARIGTETTRGFVFADLSGRMWATQSGLTVGERSVHFVGLSGGVALGPVTPAVEVRTPIGERDSGMGTIVRIGARVRW